MKKSNLQRGYRTPDNKTLKTTYKISSRIEPGVRTHAPTNSNADQYGFIETQAFSGAEIDKSSWGREIVKHYNKPEYKQDRGDGNPFPELKVQGTIDFGENSVPFGVKVKPKVSHPITWFSGV